MKKELHQLCKHLSLLISAALFLEHASAAEVGSRNSAGLGWTSNASLLSTNPDSDFFWLVSTRNSLKTDLLTWGLGLGYTDYFGSATNDVLTGNLSSSWSPEASSGFALKGDLFIQQYPNGSPANTDISFNSRGIGLSAEQLLDAGNLGEFTLGGGYRLTHYSVVDRTDHQFAVSGNLNHEFSTERSLDIFSEVAVIPSSVSIYSRNHVQLGASYDHSLNENWRIIPSLSYRATFFSNRATSTTTVTTQKRKAPVVTTSTEQESYGWVNLSADIIYAFNPSARVSFAPGLVSQTSNSGSQNYSAFEMIFKFTLSL